MGAAGSCCVPLEGNHVYLIRVPSEEPLLASLNLQGYYHRVAGVHHCRAVLSPQRLQERNERAGEMSQRPQVGDSGLLNTQKPGDLNGSRHF